MPLVYRSVFTDADGAIARQLEDQFKSWLRSKELAVPNEGFESRGNALHSASDSVAWASEHRASLPTGDMLHRLRLVEDLPDERWTTTAVAIARHDVAGPMSARIWIDVEHEPGSGQRPRRPGSPRLVRELIATGEAFDGPVPMTADAWTVHGAHVDELGSWIASPARSIPIIVFAHDATRAYDQAKLARLLARDLAGVAAVLRLRDGDATERLATVLPAEYAVWAGSMRTYLPGAVIGPDDLATRHRVLGRTSLVALGQRAFPAVKDQILTRSVEQPAPVTRTSGRTVKRPIHDIAAIQGRFAALNVPPVGPGWLRERIARMRRALGLAPPPSPAGHAAAIVAEFDEALETLIERAGKTAPTSGGDDGGSASIVPPMPERPEAVANHDALTFLTAELDKEREDRNALEELLDELQGQFEERIAADKWLEMANDELVLEATEAAEEADRLNREVRFLRRRLRDLNDFNFNEPAGEALPAAPASVAEVVLLARQHLTHLRIGVNVDHTAAELDLHGRAQLFAVKSWAALCALDAYAAARSGGSFVGSFVAWCSNPPPGEPALSANAVALVESETVGRSPVLRQTRVFPVPAEANPDKVAYMEAHVKIVKRGAPAPRLHFLDDAVGSGLVYVGYLGEHLPTARFS